MLLLSHPSDMIWSSCSEISAAMVIPNSKIKICKLGTGMQLLFCLKWETQRKMKQKRLPAIRHQHLQEAKGIITTSNQVLNVVVLPPTAGDSGSDDTDPEYVPDDPEDEFDPAGELEVEEELDVEEFEDIKLSQKQRGALPQWKKSEDLVEQLQPNENFQNMASLTLLESNSYAH
ncbi:Protein dispatched [Trichinella spiralis]|uniref:Protein dispatched n=1 Tax=Trichinella spiralis TaxID=6334 RepID=A0ABR3KI51_TRISP